VTIVFDGSSNDATDDGDGNASTEFRVVITSGLASASGTQAQVSFRSGNAGVAGATPTITGAWIGQGAGAGSTSFKGNQVQLKFAGANTFSITVGSGQTVTSDVVTLGETFDNTKNYIVSFRFADATNNAHATASGATFTGVNSNFLGGTTLGDEGNTAPQGGMTAQTSVLQFLRQIIITAAGGDTLGGAMQLLMM